MPSKIIIETFKLYPKSNQKEEEISKQLKLDKNQNIIIKLDLNLSVFVINDISKN